MVGIAVADLSITKEKGGTCPPPSFIRRRTVDLWSGDRRLLLLDPATGDARRDVVRVAQLLHHEFLDAPADERHGHLDLALELAPAALAPVERRDDVVAPHVEAILEHRSFDLDAHLVGA